MVSLLSTFTQNMGIRIPYIVADKYNQSVVDLLEAQEFSKLIIDASNKSIGHDFKSGSTRLRFLYSEYQSLNKIIALNNHCLSPEKQWKINLCDALESSVKFAKVSLKEMFNRTLKMHKKFLMAYMKRADLLTDSREAFFNNPITKQNYLDQLETFEELLILYDQASGDES